MPVKLLDAESVQRTIAKLGVWDGTALIPFRTLKMMDADGVTLRTIASFTGPLAATVAPSPVNRTQVGPIGSSVTTGSVTCTVTGGVGPFTYAWSLTAYSSVSPPTIGSPSSASTTFTQPSMDGTETATFQCVVTDALGASITVSVNATFNLVEL